MSYSCAYWWFDEKSADKKWETENLLNLKDCEEDDNELMMHDLELGGDCVVSLDRDKFNILCEVISAHGIKIESYPSLKNVSDLLLNLNTQKVHAVLQRDDSNEYESKTREGFDLSLQKIQYLLKNEDASDTKYSIEGLEKYMVPLLETCGIFTYSIVTKGQLVDFDGNFTDKKYEKALCSELDSYKKAIGETSKIAEEDLLKSLVQFKELLLLMSKNKHYTLVFLDDCTDFPKKLLDRLVITKARLSA